MSDHVNISADVTRSEHLLRQLQSNARKSKQEALARLWTVLLDIQRSGIGDFTLANVGNRFEQVGGLRTQSLRNKGGEDYRQLIEAFANDVSGTSTRSRDRRVPPPDRVDAILDLQLRAWVRQILAENKILARKADELKSAFKVLRVFEPNSPIQESRDETNITQLGLSASDLEVLKKSFDPARFAENGWTVSSDGSVTDDIGISVFPPGFMGAISKLPSFRGS